MSPEITIKRRAAIEKLYDGKCTISKRTDIIDEDGAVCGFEESIVVSNEPCRLSYGKAGEAAEQTETVNMRKQKCKLFVAPEIEIPAGSKIIVTQDGVTKVYRNSSEPVMRSTHQEITLSTWSDYA